MKNKKLYITILLTVIIVILLLIAIFKAIPFIIAAINTDNNITADMKINREYEVTLITANDENLSMEFYLIKNKEDKIIDTRVIINGYTEEELNEEFSKIKQSNTIRYNPSIKGNTLIYNSTHNNAMTTNEAIDYYKNNYRFSNINIIEL